MVNTRAERVERKNIMILLSYFGTNITMKERGRQEDHLKRLWTEHPYQSASSTHSESSLLRRV